MNVQSNKYIYTYSIILISIVAVVLTLVSVALKPFQEENRRIEKMLSILYSINVQTKKETVANDYKRYIVNSFVVDSKGEIVKNKVAFEINVEEENKKPFNKRMLPVYVAEVNNEKKYIIALYGKGLWGPIWGFLSLNNDFNTVYGCYFDHKGETPGLGAEIATFEFQKQFKNKKLFDEQKNFVGIKTVKGGADKNNPHEVDAISGGTITSDCLTKMLFDGIKNYIGFLKKGNNYGK
ncbi:MAG: NADH:ubiquinone reductase (Na(+)-transporting) subunit C [Bacteroidales bacterium]|nr:NADH:ubiquinone reductase (Na(+)-transporting) subunit C [Bacteroidales bacterium]